MTPERFAEVAAVFYRLSELDPDRRQRALEQLKEEDEDLALEAEHLLTASEATFMLDTWMRTGSDGRLPRNPGLPARPGPPGLGPPGLGPPGLGPPGLGSPGDPGPGDTDLPESIGAFRILKELGRGGMGVVYLGVRDDDFHQRVAVKVVKRGMDTDEILDHLRRERRILASLEHPNIARLIDGGSTADGRPYFAMEYIEGQELLAWCDSRSLGITARLRLFLEICSAVGYAHRNLVIHRDLKPSNILVTEDGTAKLLDFGIAKLLAPEADRRTATGRLMLTPEYASPEQVLGEPLTTATDIYSLGVVLFRLLTGVHPYGEQVKNIGALFDFAREASVVKASVRVLERRDTEVGLASGPPSPPAKLARALRGDLDNILGMALRRQPERRYPSVVELAEDLRRHLDLRPVRAHPETFGYRFGRFVQRQRVLVAAGSLIFLSLAGGIAGTSWQAHRAELARQRAEAQADLATTVSDYLVEIFGEPDPGKHLGDEPRARDLLERGRERLEALEGQPRLLATLALVIGQAYQKLGDQAEALELYQRCLEVRQALSSPPHADLVEAYLFLADAESPLGHTAEAEAHLLSALEQQRQLDDNPPAMATLINDLGVNSYRGGDPVAAEAWLTEALELRRRHLGPRHADTAQTLSNLAAVRLARDAPADAAALMREALDIVEEQLGAGHPGALRRRANLAATLLRLGRVDEVLVEYERLISTQRKVYGGAHPELGRSLNNLGWALLQGERPTQAIEPFREAAEILSATPGAGHPDHLSALLGLAGARAASGDPRAALADYDHAVHLLRNRQESTPRWAIAAQSGRGRVLRALGRRRDAIDALCLALELRESVGSSAGDQDRQILTELLEVPGEAEATSSNCRRLSSAEADPARAEPALKTDP